MATSKNIQSLVLNQVESKEVFHYMKSKGLLNEDEFYFTPDEIDSSLNGSSENPVQNKVIYEALANKIDKNSDLNATHKITTEKTMWAKNGLYAGDGSFDNTICLKCNNSKSGKVVTADDSLARLSVGTPITESDAATKKYVDDNKVTVDSALSANSTNPIQNKTVYAELSKKINASTATQSVDGLMSKDDKAKLDRIESGANKTIVDNAMSSDSTNPVQNKVIQAALNWKMSTSPGFIELNPGANAGHGGYLDFHYNGSSEDYTSRIIEQSSGVLNVPGTFKVNDSNVLTEASISALLLKMYPVGSIYISTNNANPKTLFGGTWVQIKDVFLLAAGTTYKAGATGGEATHTLTLGEMPEHAHEMYSANSSGSSTWTPNAGSYLVDSVTDTKNTWWSQIGMNNAGGSTAHNNMPPYLVVYVWKRTA